MLSRGSWRATCVGVGRSGGGFMETIVERPAALDVHKASVMACARVPGADGRREEHVAEFASTVQGLLTLADWLDAHAVTQVAMEATGVLEAGLGRARGPL